MKFRKKRLCLKRVIARFKLSLGRAYDKGPVVNTKTELPCIGHPSYLWFVKDEDRYYAWVKGKWITRNMWLWKVRLRTVRALDIKVQPMYLQGSVFPSLSPMEIPNG